MKRDCRLLAVSFFVFVALSPVINAANIEKATIEITIQADKPGAKISPTLYGANLEEINHALEGGLYAERIRNRSFEESDKLDGWEAVGGAEAAIDLTKPISEKNLRSIRVTVKNAQNAGVANSGNWGVTIAKDAAYDLSLFARAEKDFSGGLTVALVSEDGKTVYAEKQFDSLTTDWKNYKLALTPNASDPKAKLALYLSKPGTAWLDMVSLFPQKTWKNRSNIVRQDLAELIAEMQPGFIRFSAGCGHPRQKLADSFLWKKTIGDISERLNQFSPWGYFTTNGFGFHEYLQFCEDAGAEPILVLNSGITREEKTPLNQMNEYVQDALDAIEYSVGPETSRFGKLRAEAGHPQPFNLHYVEIGDCQMGEAYRERFGLFFDAIKKQYPQLKIATFDRGVLSPKQKPDVITERIFAGADFFIRQAKKYDSYDRNDPKILVGAFAATRQAGKGNLHAAVAEAAFLTGLERNADVVTGAAYAPLLANVNDQKWSPALIRFNGAQVYATPSYYVQKMFSENRGDRVLPVNIEYLPVEEEKTKTYKIGLGTWETQAEFKDVKVTHGTKTLFQSDFENKPEDWDIINGEWAPKEGVLSQTASDAGDLITAANVQEQDYDISLKARKTGGKEGFLILFNVEDEKNYVWWNVGGWGNKQHGMQYRYDGKKADFGKNVPGTLENDRWYDVKIEVRDRNVSCYLDGKLIQKAKIPQRDNSKAETVAVGLGTWKTQAEFKDVKVTADDKIVLKSDFTKNADSWNVLTGEWEPKDEALRQTASDEGDKIVLGEFSAKRYVLSAKARKLAGSEGFLVLFNVIDDKNYVWWNVGGWGNSNCGLQTTVNDARAVVGSLVPGKIEDNRWYDLRVEVVNREVRCFLDGKFIQQATLPRTTHWTPVSLGAKKTAYANTNTVAGSPQEPVLIPEKGAIALGAWNTQVEFMDVKVSQGEKTLLAGDFKDWKFVRGEWEVKDGVLRQSGSGNNLLATAGDPSWTDYTLSLKARKTGGDEGFLIAVRMADEKNYLHWNLGGWGNKQHGVEWINDGQKTTIGKNVSGEITTDRWYDVRMDVSGDEVRCYLDGVLVQSINVPAAEQLFVSASLSEKKDELILKIVNVSGILQNAEIILSGVKVDADAQATVLTTANATDENSFATPRLIAPSVKKLGKITPVFGLAVEPNSVTALRVKIKP